VVEKQGENTDGDGSVYPGSNASVPFPGDPVEELDPGTCRGGRVILCVPFYGPEGIEQSGKPAGVITAPGRAPR
jgi:hypothetical protein